MKKALILALSIAAIMVVSSVIVFSHPEQWGRGSGKWQEGDLATFEGKVLDVGRPTAAIEAGEKEYIVHLGPFWYSQDKEYPLKEGQTVKITGMVEEIYGKLHVYPRAIESEGKPILDSDRGFPDRGGYCHGYDDDNWHRGGHMHGMYGGRERIQSHDVVDPSTIIKSATERVAGYGFWQYSTMRLQRPALSSPEREGEITRAVLVLP